ncbi:MAG: prepilin peptidase [Patescibacteria group bacterium]
MFYFLIFVFGLVIGSFLNVVIFRLRSGEKIVNSRSHCRSCKKQLTFKDLIPLVSFVWQKGRCRYCGAKISWQYPLVELVTGLLFVAATFNIIGNLGAGMLFYNSDIFFNWLKSLVFISFLVVIFVYDLKWLLILDKITLPAGILALAFNLFLGISWKSLLLGVVVGLGFFLIQFLVSRGRWIGGGDLRLAVVMGLMLGWPKILVALFFAYIIGALIALILMAWGKRGLKSQVPFGTFLSLGTLVAIFWGEEIIKWYLSLV